MVITIRQKRENTAKLPTLLVEKDPTETVDSHRVLGVVTDNNLTWHDYVNFLSKNLSRKVNQLRRVKHFLNLQARKAFLHVHIISVICYGSILFDAASKNALKPLLCVYKRVVKVVLLKSTKVVSSHYADLKI